MHSTYSNQIPRNREPAALCSEFHLQRPGKASTLICVREWKTNSGDHNEIAANWGDTGRQESVRIDPAVFYDNQQITGRYSQAWERNVNETVSRGKVAIRNFEFLRFLLAQFE